MSRSVRHAQMTHDVSSSMQQTTCYMIKASAVVLLRLALLQPYIEAGCTPGLLHGLLALCLILSSAPTRLCEHIASLLIICHVTCCVPQIYWVQKALYKAAAHSAMARTKQGGVWVYGGPEGYAKMRRRQAILRPYEDSTRSADVQPATELCGRIYWVELDSTKSCAACGATQELVRDTSTNEVLCELDVLRRVAVHTLLVCKAVGMDIEPLKRAILQAVFGSIPLASIAWRPKEHSDEDGSDMEEDS